MSGASWVVNILAHFTLVVIVLVPFRFDGMVAPISRSPVQYILNILTVCALMACSTYVVVGLTCRAGMPSPRRNWSKVSGRCPTCADILFQLVISLNGVWLM